MEGHTDYINDVAYDVEKGEHIVSVSDDQTCRLWTADGEEKACLPLGAPGMSVHWHTEDPLKVRGRVNIYHRKGIRKLMQPSPP